MTADAGAVPAGEGLPALNVSWDGAATPTLTVEALSPDGKDPKEALLT